MDRTLNLNLPLLQPAQAAKHITINESLVAIDAAAQTRLSGVDQNSPPDERSIGHTYATGLNSSGAWTLHPHSLAVDLGTDWRFISLQPGFRAVDLSDLSFILWTGSEWQPVGDRSGTQQFTSLGVGTGAAPGQTLTVEGASALLTADADDFRLSLNRSGESDVSSVLWQTGFVTKAEVGLLESDRLTVRTFGPGGQAVDHLSAAANVAGIECPAYRSVMVTSDDQDVQAVIPPRNSGIVMICSSEANYPQIHFSGILTFDTGVSPNLRTLALDDGLTNRGATDLRQTAGQPGQISISAGNGELLFYNAYGPMTLALTFVC